MESQEDVWGQEKARKMISICVFTGENESVFLE